MVLFGRKDRRGGEGNGTDRYLVCRTEIKKYLILKPGESHHQAMRPKHRHKESLTRCEMLLERRVG